MRGQQRFEWRRLVVRDAHLTDATRRVLMELESYADPEGNNAHPGVQRIAEQLRTPEGKAGHVSEKTVRTALQTGVDRGFIELVQRAPRRRGNKLSAVYRLTMPEGEFQDETSLPEPVRPATAITGNTTPVTPVIQTAGASEVYTGNQSELDRQSEAVRPVIQTTDHQILNTRSLTPDPSSSHLSNADARASEEPSPRSTDDGRRSATDRGGDALSASEVITTPRADGIDTIEVLNSDTDPLGWIEREIPQGFLIGERDRAREILAKGIPAGSVRYALLGERTDKRKRRTA